jgi:hypothetical protein
LLPAEAELCIAPLSENTRWRSFYPDTEEGRGLKHLFVLVSFGDLLGVPILPPYYSLRLLPYIVPLLNRWRYRMLREKDLTDLVG